MQHSFKSSGNVNGGRLIGATDTDYFYFFCPECKDTNILQILDFQTDAKEHVEYNQEDRKNHKRDFIVKFDLYCPKCKMRDIVKISNTGWQDGKLKDVPNVDELEKSLKNHIDQK